MALLKKSPSKKDLDAYKYKKELREWLSNHEKPIAEKYHEEYENAQYYKNFMNSLNTDRRPIDTASLILSTENLSSNVPVSVNRVGKVVKQRLQDEYNKQPGLSVLSPAVVLAQKRRKEVISQLESGNWPADYNPTTMIVQDDLIPPGTDLMNKKTSKFLPDDVITSPQKFEPKWEHYDTMKSRWKYLRPQTRQLVSDYVAPTNASSYVKLNGTQLYGKQVDIDYFQSKVRSHSRNINGRETSYSTSFQA